MRKEQSGTQTGHGDAEIGVRIASLIESDFDSFSDVMISAFFREFPHSESTSLSHMALKTWTRDEMADLLACLRGEEPLEPQDIIYAGDIQVRVSPLFQPLVSHMETWLFIARTVAAYIWPHFAEHPVEAQRALAEVERATLKVMRVNMRHFIDTRLVAGSISQSWGVGFEAGARAGVSIDASSPRAAAALAGLTQREYEIARLVAKGKTNGEIAADLGIARNTVKNHLARAFDKLNVNTRTELTRRAIDLGIC